MANTQSSFRLAVFWRVLLVTIVPIAAMGVLTGIYIRQNTMIMIEQSSRSTALTVAAATEAYLNSARALTTNTAELLKGPDRPAGISAQQVLQSIVVASPSIEVALLLDRNGIIETAGTTQVKENLNGLDMSHHPGYTLSRNPDQLIWTPASRSPWSARQSVALAIRAGEHTVLAILNLDAMQAAINRYATGDVVISLVDQDKLAFARVGGSSETPPLDVGRLPQMQSEADATERVGFGEDEKLVSVARISPTGWMAHVSEPVSSAYHPVRRADMLVLTLTCGAIILVGAFAAMLGGRFARPIEALGSASAAMVRGGYRLTLPVQPYEETEEVAHTFREMASAIRQRDEELQAVQKTLEFASSASRGPAFFADVVGVLAMITGARCVFATEWIPGGKPRARIIAAKANVALQEDFTYELGGNPCMQVKMRNIVHIARNVLQDFPESPLLRLLGAQAYIAVPLKLSDGTVAGHLAVIDDHELPLDQHTRDLMLLLGARGGAELDRNMAERRLLETEILRKSLIQDQIEIICRTTIDGAITLANDAWCAWAGKRREDLLGRSIMQIVHEEDRELVRSHFARLRPAYPTEVSEHRVHDDQGQVRWVRWVSRVIADAKGRALEFQITGHDITSLKLVEAALAEAQQRFKIFAEYSSTALLIADWPTHRTAYASPAFEKIWGMPTSPAGDGPMAWTTAIHEEDRARVVRNFLLYAGESQFNEEYRVIRPDGSTRRVRATAMPLRERDGRVARIACIIEDITLNRPASTTT